MLKTPEEAPQLAAAAGHSVCCGFGGRLVGLANHKQQISDPMTGQVRPQDAGTVTLSQVSRQGAPGGGAGGPFSWWEG